MSKLRPFLALAAGLMVLPISSSAQPQQQEWEVQALYPPQGRVVWTNDVVMGTEGVWVKYGGAVLIADRATVYWQTGEAVADGRVRIQRDDLVWAGEHVRFNFKTRRMETEVFRAGKSPVFAEGKALQGDASNRVYTAHSAYLTTDDVDKPFAKIRASSIRIVPGQYIEARNAVLYLGAVPVFYYPYYSRNLGEHANNFSFTPGYRSRFGPFLLGTYTWFLNDALDGAVHLDYRLDRGVGAGPDLNWHLGRWGEATLKYYYLRDDNPGSNSITGLPLPTNRQRLYFSYDASPFTNFHAKALVRYQSDPLLNHDFFLNDYRNNPQPNTYVELNRIWSNFSLDTYAQPRLDDFFETVERLPDVKLTGFRQQLGATPVFYESESSAGYYRRLFAETNGPPSGLDYYAARADTYHQLLLPRTFLGWLNFAPRVGGRFDYYGRASGPGGTNQEVYRGIFNTGAELTFKASRLWPNLTNGVLALDGLRHIIQPSVNYVFVPAPHPGPAGVSPFDYELPSLRLLPIDFPDYNSIDSIDSQNVLRWGLQNRFQTKRDGQIEDVLRWDIYTDWRLRPRTNQTTFADLYSDLLFRPRSWIAFESETRYDIAEGNWRMSFHNLTLQPGERWSWSLGHWYLRDDLNASPTALGLGNNLIISTLFFRLNENWGFRAGHHFEARDGRLQEQNYTIYRDLRSWTAALTFRALDNLTGPVNYTVAFTFSLKARPRFGLGGDAVRPYHLLGN